MIRHEKAFIAVCLIIAATLFCLLATANARAAAAGGEIVEIAEKFRAENGRYAQNQEELGFSAKKNDIRFKYKGFMFFYLGNDEGYEIYSPINSSKDMVYSSAAGKWKDGHGKEVKPYNGFLLFIKGIFE